MKTHAFIIAVVLSITVGTAFAMHCPADMKKIDEALSGNPPLSAEQLAEVAKYRQAGETLHKDGKHQESVDALAKALKILNIK